MRVKQLIESTIWLPGSQYGEDNPIVSILLPTFRRGKSGLFQKSVRSVLDQTFRALELIIIDDASADGTMDQIEQFMISDGRVSCLRHPFNIGLPAVSEFEGFQKARGQYIAFQFDDDEFKLDAIEKMMHAAKALNAMFIYGHVDFTTLHPETKARTTLKNFGRGNRPQSTLRFSNYISNNAVLLHRSVVETVGLYDPNIAIARLCDYDLWRRCAQHFELHCVDISVGYVEGPATVDSLGHTYFMEKWLNHEWMGLDRNRQLLPSNFGEVDVLAIPAELSEVSKQALVEMQQLFTNRGQKFMLGQNVPEVRDDQLDGYLLVIIPCVLPIGLPFDGLPINLQQRVRVVNGVEFKANIQEEIIGASAIIVVRDLFNFADWVVQADALSIPHYYYIDENFCELAKIGLSANHYSNFEINAMREALQTFEGVWCASTPLRDYFVFHDLHPHIVEVYGSWISRHLYGPSILSPALPGELTLLLFDDGKVNAEFFELVFPALEALCREVPVRLITVGGGNIVDVKRADIAGLRTFRVPSTLDFRVAIGHLKQTQIDLIVHLGGGEGIEGYGALEVSAIAAQLNIPLLYGQRKGGTEHPYDSYIFYVEHNFQAWLGQIRDFLNDRSKYTNRAAQLAAYWDSKYLESSSTKMISQLLRKHPPAGLLLRGARYHAALIQLKKHMSLLAANIPVVAEKTEITVQNRDEVKASSQKITAIEAPSNSPSTKSFASKLATFVVDRIARKPEEYLRFYDSSRTPDENSDSVVCRTLISNRTFREYSCGVFEGTVTKIKIPLDLNIERLLSAEFGVEIVSPADEIVFHCTQPLTQCTIKNIVFLDVPAMSFAITGWRIRVFLRSANAPVYLYERRPHSVWSRLFMKPALFFDLM
jgi:glycosyltransferase involved in cell wall biosynthesis